LDQAARAFLSEFCAKDSLCDSQTVREVDGNRDEIIRLQSRSDFRRSQEVPEKPTTVVKLLPMHFNKAFPDTLASTSSHLEFSPKHDIQSWSVIRSAMASLNFFNRLLPDGSSFSRDWKIFRWRACSSRITARNSSSFPAKLA
jgi:hypothetical protein